MRASCNACAAVFCFACDKWFSKTVYYNSHQAGATCQAAPTAADVQHPATNPHPSDTARESARNQDPDLIHFDHHSPPASPPGLDFSLPPSPSPSAGSPAHVLQRNQDTNDQPEPQVGIDEENVLLLPGAIENSAAEEEDNRAAALAAAEAIAPVGTDHAADLYHLAVLRKESRLIDGTFLPTLYYAAKETTKHFGTFTKAYTYFLLRHLRGKGPRTMANLLHPLFFEPTTASKSLDFGYESISKDSVSTLPDSLKFVLHPPLYSVPASKPPKEGKPPRRFEVAIYNALSRVRELVCTFEEVLGFVDSELPEAQQQQQQRNRDNDTEFWASNAAAESAGTVPGGRTIFLFVYLDGLWVRHAWNSAGPVAIYITIGNLPRSIRFARESIRTISIVHPEANLNNVMEIILRDVCEKRFSLDDRLYKVRLTALIGDMVAQNDAAGMSKSLGCTTKFCRCCEAARPPKQQQADAAQQPPHHQGTEGNFPLAAAESRDIDGTRADALIISSTNNTISEADRKKLKTDTGLHNAATPFIRADIVGTSFNVHRHTVIDLLHLLFIGSGLFVSFLADVLFPYLTSTHQAEAFHNNIAIAKRGIILWPGERHVRDNCCEHAADLTGQENRVLVRIACICTRGLIGPRDIRDCLQSICRVCLMLAKPIPAISVGELVRETKKEVQKICNILSDKNSPSAGRFISLHRPVTHMITHLAEQIEEFVNLCDLSAGPFEHHHALTRALFDSVSPSLTPQEQLIQGTQEAGLANFISTSHVRNIGAAVFLSERVAAHQRVFSNKTLIRVNAFVVDEWDKLFRVEQIIADGNGDVIVLSKFAYVKDDLLTGFPIYDKTQETIQATEKDIRSTMVHVVKFQSTTNHDAVMYVRNVMYEIYNIL
jgi:hypothetical protein